MIYVASRTRHAAMWRSARQSFPISSTWIDEAGEGQTADLGELWQRIAAEVAASRCLVFQVYGSDLPLKGALVEVGMALALGKPVLASIVDCALEEPGLRPIGSWLRHPLVTRYASPLAALRAAERIVCASSPTCADPALRYRTRIALLRGAVLAAAQVFEAYQKIHQEKGSAAGQRKAEANRDLAVKMRDALAKTEGP